MSKNKENVIYDNLTLDQWRERTAQNPNLEVTVFTSGISMFPLLRSKGDSVKLIPYQRDMKIGDIIMFIRSDGREIIHRLCWIGEDAVQTIGDNCDRRDAIIPTSSVVGLVTHVCRRGHMIHVDSGFWVLYGKFMMWSNPFRMFIRNRIYRPLRRMARRIIKGK